MGGLREIIVERATHGGYAVIDERGALLAACSDFDALVARMIVLFGEGGDAVHDMDAGAAAAAEAGAIPVDRGDCGGFEWPSDAHLGFAQRAAAEPVVEAAAQADEFSPAGADRDAIEQGAKKRL